MEQLTEVKVYLMKFVEDLRPINGENHVHRTGLQNRAPFRQMGLHGTQAMEAPRRFLVWTFPQGDLGGQTWWAEMMNRFADP